MNVIEAVNLHQVPNAPGIGHDEEEDNLHQFLKCRAEDNTGIEEWLKHGSYLSRDIINEIIQLMANHLL